MLKDSTNAVTNFTDPFKRSQCERISIDIYREAGRVFDDKTATVEASLRFKSGQTTGYHTITGVDLKSVLEKTEEFLKSRE